MKVRYLLTFPQIQSISLLAHIDGTIMSARINDKKIVAYDITEDQKDMLDSLLNQKGFVVKDKPQWPSQGDKYYYIDDTGYILHSKWDMIDDTTPTEVDISRHNIGNIFKTLEEAKFACERLKIYNKLKSLSDDDQEWNGENEHYHIVYDPVSNTFDVQVRYGIKEVNGYWFKSEESALAAISTIGEDKLKKYIFNIKE